MLCSVSLFLMNIFSWLAAFIQIPYVIFDWDAKCGGFPSYEIVFTHNSYSNFVIHRVWGRKNVHQWIGIIYIPGMDLPFGVWNICTCIKSWNISNLPTKGIFRIYWDQITWWKTQVFPMIQHQTLYYWQHSLYLRCFSTEFAVWKNPLPHFNVFVDIVIRCQMESSSYFFLWKQSKRCFLRNIS